MDGTRIIRIELDLDENGKVERWDFYKAGGELEKVGLSRLNDGVMDAQAFYEPGKFVGPTEKLTEKIREAIAIDVCKKELRLYKVGMARQLSLQEKCRQLRAQLDAVRTLSANVRGQT